MAKVKSLQPKLKEKAKNKAKQLRYKFAKTDKQKEFLDENPSVRTASEMEAAIAQNKRAEETQNKMSLPYATNVKSTFLYNVFVTNPGIEFCSWITVGTFILIPANRGMPELYPPVPTITEGLYFLISLIDSKYDFMNLIGKYIFWIKEALSWLLYEIHWEICEENRYLKEWL